MMGRFGGLIFDKFSCVGVLRERGFILIFDRDSQKSRKSHVVTSKNAIIYRNFLTVLINLVLHPSHSEKKGYF